MNREGTFGVAGLLVIAAAVGVGLQPGSKPGTSGKEDRKGETKRSGTTSLKHKTAEHQPGCSAIEERLREFLATNETLFPVQCYVDEAAGKRAQPTAHKADSPQKLKFVIATLPDPLHTHLSLVFDQFTGAIQEAAQDEKYDFDSSWLPWEDGEQPTVLLADQDAADERKEDREKQPGILLFRKSFKCETPEANSGNSSANSEEKPPCKVTPGAGNMGTWVSGQSSTVQDYLDGLIIFVVGEDATHGVHREQFRNSVRWIERLNSFIGQKHPQAAILGPTFSGSFPSLAELLSEDASVKSLRGETIVELPVYSGSVSSDAAARWFKYQMNFQGSGNNGKVELHSFVQNDDTIVGRFCGYLSAEQPDFDFQQLAVVSEDETAYGSSGIKDKDCFANALKLYYPRDISALRGAYQTKSLFTTSDPSGSTDAQKRNLPTDLADPAGIVHDSIRSYAGNQTPLAQEAFMLEIVAGLKAFHAKYILLRSSNTLDQLFLTDFLHRMYPDGRLVIMSSDLLFIRERGATGLSGTLALSTYPLFPLERDWTEYRKLPAADRVFSGDTPEGTYVAFRLLLNSKGLNSQGQDPKACHTTSDGDKEIFLPKIACETDPPIPDYSPPQWMLSEHCGETTKGESCPYQGPATWLSVIGQNRFWPVAALTDETLKQESWLTLPRFPPPATTCPSDANRKEPGQTPEMPGIMKLFLLALTGLGIFHVWCCGSGSYTAKPAFRAHFATTKDWSQTRLVLIGSSLLAALAMVSGWGCGLFFPGEYGVMQPWIALAAVVLICLLMWGAVLAHSYSTWTLARNEEEDSAKAERLEQNAGKDSAKPEQLAQAAKKDSAKSEQLSQEYKKRNTVTSVLLLAVIAGCLLFFIVPIENTLLKGNRVTTYWRSMHLASGVSPILPILAILFGLYVAVWYALHGLALFGLDKPRLPPEEKLLLDGQGGERLDFLKMFSQEKTAAQIESIAMPLNESTAKLTGALALGFFLAAVGLAWGVPVQSLGAQRYAYGFFFWLDICCSLTLAKTWQLYELWEELRKLLAFLDLLPLRRTMAALHGFSWGSVWTMSGNVLEVRYKVISRQLESMNHTIKTLEDYKKEGEDSASPKGIRECLKVLEGLRDTGKKFAGWYSTNYKDPRAGNLRVFEEFQQSVAAASGTVLAQLLVPVWRKEEESLVLAPAENSKKEGAAPAVPAQSKEKYVQNAEEFVCLTYLGYVQNVLGRIRTMAMTVVVLFIAATVAMSSYPFDPRQALSAVLLGLFVVAGATLVKVYAEMHRDATLSHVTNTNPGELGTEFWFRIVGFGFAPAAGLLTRIFPGITDFVFSWLQPGISSLK
ncbi:MAG TPA: hypothetical protein VFI38_11895 [Candidatus Acidoferrum sp.]|nr:hypothetical protein [Candidatus Acidoferrum sp.]